MDDRPWYWSMQYLINNQWKTVSRLRYGAYIRVEKAQPSAYRAVGDGVSYERAILELMGGKGAERCVHVPQLPVVDSDGECGGGEHCSQAIQRGGDRGGVISCPSIVGWRGGGYAEGY
jgi:hypothetical protein